jgi:phosphomannomutase
MAEALTRLRAAPPTSLEGIAVTSMTDYALGAAERPPYLGQQDLLSLELGSSQTDTTIGRVLVRPSGTEPKLKLYVHLRRMVRGDAGLDSASWELRELGLRVGDALVARLGLG